MHSKFKSSKIIANQVKFIIEEIELLISKRKDIETDFELLRKKLLKGKKTSVIDSSNWEDWKMLSLEYDQIKQIINEIDEKCLLLRQIQTSRKKKYETLD